MPNQVDSGLAWEHSILTAWREIAPRAVIEVASQDKARRCEEKYASISVEEQSTHTKASQKALGYLATVDPNLKAVTRIRLPRDADARDGDPRDIIGITQQGKEIGISAKNRSKELKGPRLTAKSGSKWFGKPFSESFQEGCKAIRVAIKSDHKGATKWRELPKAYKNEQVYQRFTNLLIDEIQVHSSSTPNFIRYLLGKEDYYLVARENGNVHIAAYNFNGSLAWGRRVPTRGQLQDVRRYKARPGTVEIETTDGWRITLRVKNGDSRIKGLNLKLTAELSATPYGFSSNQLPY